MILTDHNGVPFKQENNPPAPNSPDKEILRVLRMIEVTRRAGLAELCAQLEETAKTGWSMTIDKNLPEDKAEATMIHHVGRTVENKITHRGERWIRLGASFTEALTLLKDKHDNRT